MTHIISVSLSDNEYKYMKESKLSPSKVLQDALKYMGTENNITMAKYNGELRLSLKKLTKFISTKDLFSEYSKFSEDFKDNVLEEYKD